MDLYDIFLPDGALPESTAKKAPLIQIGDLLAAFIVSKAGDKSVSLKPAQRKASRDQISDWAPESATACTTVFLLVPSFPSIEIFNSMEG